MVAPFSTMKQIPILLFALAYCLIPTTVIAYTDVNYTSDSFPTPGVWNTNFQTSLEYAMKSNTPILMYYGVYGCGYAERGATVLNQPILCEWFASNSIVMVYKRISTELAKRITASTSADKSADPDTWKGMRWVMKGATSSGYPIMRIYWNKPDGNEISKTFSLRNGEMPVAEPRGNGFNKMALQMVNTLDRYLSEYSGGSGGRSPHVDTIDESSGSFGIGKNVYKSAVVCEDGSLYGILSATSAKASKTGIVKVGISISDIYGKTRSASSSTTVSERHITKDLYGLGEIDVRIDDDLLHGRVGEYVVEPMHEIGGTIYDDGMSFSICDTVTIEEFPVVTDALPVDEPVALSGKKITTRKAGSVKLNKATKVIAISDTNPSGLKLSYTAATGMFKGSFKVYSYKTKEDRDGNAYVSQIKSSNANVQGYIVDGIGYGIATIKGIGMFDVKIH